LTFGEDALDYKAQAEMVRQFIRERKAFLDEVWLEDARICKVEFIGEELEDGTPDTSRSGRCFMVKAGECIQELPEESREGRTFLGWRIGSAQEMLTTGTPVMEDMTVYAVWE
jgi:Listeria-Bacteroides repeat domain (List_Bact_rpt).